MTIDTENELIRRNLEDGSQAMAAIETDLLAIEAEGASIHSKRVDRVIYALQSVKSAAGTLALEQVQSVAAKAEQVMTLIRRRELEPSPERMGVLLRATDLLREWMLNPNVSLRADVGPILAELQPDSSTVAEVPLASREKAPDGAAVVRALLVEDDFASRLLLQTFVSRYGECHVAVNGREAVAAFRLALESGQRYDLICMDLMMPEMGGREAVRQIRELEDARGILSPTGAKIVIATAVSDLQEVMACYRELCDGYLVKPIDLNQLLSLMKTYDLVQ